MSVLTTISVRCDYPKCFRGQGAPLVVQWCQEDVQQGRAPLPPEAKEIISFELNGTKLAFCNRLHAALYFLPNGYEPPPLKKIQEFPNNGNFSTEPEPA